MTKKRIQNTELGTQKVVEMPLPVKSGQAEACPTYTLRADRKCDILAMIAVLRMARESGCENLAELEAVVREFEFYEQMYLR